MNTNIDKELEAILKGLLSEAPEANDKDIIGFYIEVLKNTFTEAGYVHKSGFGYPEDVKKALNYYSGAEWYDRFDEEWSNTYLEKHDALTATEWIEAAKRASGIKEETI
jgi:hypothetical protein